MIELGQKEINRLFSAGLKKLPTKREFFTLNDFGIQVIRHGISR